MIQRFVDKVALITGAGGGIGRATALRLSREGATVFAVDLNEAGLRETASMADGTVQIHPADVSDPALCASAVEKCVASCGRLDVLGNIAGMSRSEHFTDLTVDGYRSVMGVNLDACVFLSQAAIPHLREAGGSIVNMASSTGVLAQAYGAAYSASKGAIVQLTKALAMEYIRGEVRINAVAPGAVNTPLMQKFHVPDNSETDLLMRSAPLRKAAEPEDVASLVAYLASEEAQSIHGAVLSIDNGMTAG